MSLPDPATLADQNSTQLSGPSTPRAHRRTPVWFDLSVSICVYSCFGVWLLATGWKLLGWCSLGVAAFQVAHVLGYLIAVLFSKK
jgi:hypothetical protein